MKLVIKSLETIYFTNTPKLFKKMKKMFKSFFNDFLKETAA